MLRHRPWLLAAVPYVLVAVVELRLGSLYHAVLALGVAALLLIQRTSSWPKTFAVLVPLLLGAYGIIRLWQDLRLL